VAIQPFVKVALDLWTEAAGVTAGAHVPPHPEPIAIPSTPP